MLLLDDDTKEKSHDTFLTLGVNNSYVISSGVNLTMYSNAVYLHKLGLSKYCNSLYLYAGKADQ